MEIRSIIILCLMRIRVIICASPLRGSQPRFSTTIFIICRGMIYLTLTVILERQRYPRASRRQTIHHAYD